MSRCLYYHEKNSPLKITNIRYFPLNFPEILDRVCEDMSID